MSKEKANKKAEDLCQQEAEEKVAEAEVKTEEADSEEPETEIVVEEEEAPAEEDEALNVKYMRLMADFQNYKKRTEKEKGDIYAYANEQIISEILAVTDNFERALETSGECDGFAEGMKMIFKQLKEVLKKSGLLEIEALGSDFDPNFHNAVMTEDNPDFESGKVTEVLQKGYTLNGKVIRPSMVKVNN